MKKIVKPYNRQRKFQSLTMRHNALESNNDVSDSQSDDQDSQSDDQEFIDDTLDLRNVSQMGQIDGLKRGQPGNLS